MGSWHRVLWRAPWGASVWLACWEARCVSPTQGNVEHHAAGCLHPQEHAYTWVHTSGELLDCADPEPGLLVPWFLPCASHVWGLEGCRDDGSSCIYGFGHGTTWP